MAYLGSLKGSTRGAEGVGVHWVRGMRKGLCPLPRKKIHFCPQNYVLVYSDAVFLVALSKYDIDKLQNDVVYSRIKIMKMQIYFMFRE